MDYCTSLNLNWSKLSVCAALGLQAETYVATINGFFGPSGVCALPLAAGRNVGGHYKWHFSLSFFLSLFLSSSLLILIDGVVVGIRNFAWAPK